MSRIFYIGIILGFTGCALVKQWERTGKAVEKMANVYSGTGTNIQAYVQTARIDKQEWHEILVSAWKQFWPIILALLGGTGVAGWKLYKLNPDKRSEK